MSIMEAALFLNRAAEITGDKTCRTVAQRQLDWVMGCNPFDASAIEGVGYNQPLRGLFGEFFPPTPQIPGAVSIGLSAALRSIRIVWQTARTNTTCPSSATCSG